MKLNNFIGQEEIKQLFLIMFGAAKKEGRTIPHLLFRATRGMGKTTLCEIILDIVSDTYKTFRFSTGGIDKKTILNIIGGEKPPERKMLLSDFKKKGNPVNKTPSIIFIDEIHQLNTDTQEALYDPMTHGSMFENKEIKLTPFTIMGATTDSGKLLQPFRDRFNCLYTFADYTTDEMYKIISEYNDKRGGSKYKIHKNILSTIAQRGKNNPRITKAIYDRVIEVCIMKNSPITAKILSETFSLLKIDAYGLTETDRNILRYLMNVKTAGQSHITSVLDIDEILYSEEIEPFLVKEGFIIRTPRGRSITEKGIMVAEKVKI